MAEKFLNSNFRHKVLHNSTRGRERYGTYVHVTVCTVHILYMVIGKVGIEILEINTQTKSKHKNVCYTSE